jgi:hypothetical protein
MKTDVIRNATAGAIAYRIEQLVNEGKNVINVIIIKDDAIILYKAN